MDDIVRLRAYRPMVGEYGAVEGGQVFSTRRQVAARLLAGGLACLAVEAPAVPVVPKRGLPKVACMMLTANRANLAPAAIKAFLAQTYLNRELLVYDTGKTPIAVPDDPRIRHIVYRGQRRTVTIGDLRNEAADMAAGELIAHWDDDDVSYPGRLDEQVGALMARDRVNVVGYSAGVFHDLRDSKTYRYAGPSNEAIGSSLMYWRGWWNKHRFSSTNRGEDTEFVAASRDTLYTVPGYGQMVYRIHAKSTTKKPLPGDRWTQMYFDLEGLGWYA